MRYYHQQEFEFNNLQLADYKLKWQGPKRLADESEASKSNERTDIQWNGQT